MDVTKAQELAAYAVNASYDEIPEAIRQQLKIRIIDSLGCAIGALGGEPILALRRYLKILGNGPKSPTTVIGVGTASPDRAAFFNSALVRYLDFNDSYLAKGETCHPSDNLGAVLAASEYADALGRDLITALAVAYQVQCRLSDEAPVRAKGFDHTVQGSYGMAAGISRALGLDEEKTANAIGICGTAFNALRVTRTGALSNWKGLAAPNTALCCVHASFLAAQGITGPTEVFEGNKGFMDSMAGPFEIDWSKEGFDRISKTILKKYNAEIHSQAAIEGALEIKKTHGFTADEIDRVEIDIFGVAYHIIGGGEEGDKTIVRTKEEADHSLQYMIAVGLIDGRVMPEQYDPERIVQRDVQDLLRRVIVREDPEYSRRFPQEHACRVTIFLKKGQALVKEKAEYEGFHTNPMRWGNVVAKFERLSEPYASGPLRKSILDSVFHIEEMRVREFTRILSEIRRPLP
jgi:2-methylcitrate dehydratase